MGRGLSRMWSQSDDGQMQVKWAANKTMRLNLSRRHVPCLFCCALPGTAHARGFLMTEALAMENKLKLGGQSVTLDMARLFLGTPDVEKLMASP